MSRSASVVLPRMSLLLGSFYRDRAGHKYVCFAEGEAGTDLMRCLRVHDAKTFLYPLNGQYSVPGDGARELAQDFVEEVQPDAPVFVDPTADVEGFSYDAMWERVQVMPSGIEIVKFSPKTATRDITMANKDIPSAIRNKLDRNNIGKLWRVRLSKQTRARYEWDIDRAVALVMSRSETLD